MANALCQGKDSNGKVAPMGATTDINNDPAANIVDATSSFKQDGASKIAAITLDGTAQVTTLIPETRVIVYNGSDAVVFIEVGLGAQGSVVADTSQPLATLQSVVIIKDADDEIAVIGAGTGKVHFSPQVSA